MTRLHDLHLIQGQSPWLDNLRRDEILNGHVADLVARGVRGITSNPTIFQKAIMSSSAYDEQIEHLAARGLSVQQIYWDLVVQDVVEACRLLAHVHEGSDGEDGFVSLEVDPHLSADASGTVKMALDLAKRVDRSNLMIKVPATFECLPAITEILGHGISVNVTLIFGLDRYRQVLDAFALGMQQCASTHPDLLPSVRSVASFFVSRVDSTVDPRLIAADRTEMCGHTAVHQARAAYAMQNDYYSSSPMWAALENRGAKRQRPLWASTSTKNPEYPDLLYVDNLIGPNSVNTLPEATLIAFEDHGTVERTIDKDVSSSVAFLDQLDALGIDMLQIADILEREGIVAFSQSFDQLLDALSSKVR